MMVTLIILIVSLTEIKEKFQKIFKYLRLRVTVNTEKWESVNRQRERNGPRDKEKDRGDGRCYMEPKALTLAAM